jgi:predicted dehydrogenase
VLGDASVQAVFVLTPPYTHLDIVARCAAAGKHVLLEKPLEIDSMRSHQLVDACRDAGVKLGMMLQHRLRPAALAMAERVASGALGQMTSAQVDIRWWRPQSYYDVPGRGTRERDGGGVLITQGIHTLDMYLSIVGAPSEVAAFANTSAAHRMECEDVVAAALRYANGAATTINETTAAFPGFAEKVEYSGTLGTATLCSGLLEVHYLDGKLETFGQKQATGFSANPMDFTHHSHQAVIEDFLDAIANAREPTITGASALVVHRLIDVLLESAATRRFVSF